MGEMVNSRVHHPQQESVRLNCGIALFCFIELSQSLDVLGQNALE